VQTLELIQQALTTPHFVEGRDTRVTAHKAGIEDKEKQQFLFSCEDGSHTEVTNRVLQMCVTAVSAAFYPACFCRIERQKTSLLIKGVSSVSISCVARHPVSQFSEGKFAGWPLALFDIQQFWKTKSERQLLPF
jgi:hypothetical protein